jgi:hypothetical protein
MQQLPGESSINQFGLPWVAACGQQIEMVLRADQFEVWQAARALMCGHPNGDDETCRICQGGMMVAEAFGASDHVKILPMR